MYPDGNRQREIEQAYRQHDQAEDGGTRRDEISGDKEVIGSRGERADQAQPGASKKQ